MIDLLKRRGEAIKASDSATVFVTEYEIRKHVPKQYWTNITGVFVTFERDTDVILAKEICEKAKPTLFGQPLAMERALEPSTYIWEHMGYTRTTRCVKATIVMALLTIVLALAYQL